MTRDQLIETMARADADFDGRPWDAMPSGDRKRYIARKTAALTAIEAVGMRVVPVEPTEHMMEKYKRAFISNDRFDGAEVYQAMLDAAQEDSTSE